MRITTTRDAQLTKVKALLHGDSGIGKTTSARTLPPDRTVVITSERGVLPLRDLDLTVLQVEKWDDLDMIHRHWMAPDECHEEVSKALKGKDILFVDSLSSISHQLIDRIIGIDRAKLIMERTEGARTSPEKVYEDLMTMEDYSLYRSRMGGVIKAFCDLPCHVIMTSLSSWTKDKIGGVTMWAPGLLGKLALECPASFDLVFHMENAEEERVWRTFNDGEIIAKDASGVLERFEAPNWTEVLTKIGKGQRNG